MNKNSLLTLSDPIEADPTSQRSPLKKKLTIDNFNLGILLIAVIALAFSPIFTKLSESELSPTATIFNRLWLATIITSCWQLIETPTRLSEIQFSQYSDRQEQGLLMLASLSATLSALLWAISFNHTSIASSTALRSLTPLFISFGAWLIFQQQFESKFIWGMVLSITGGMAIGWNDLQIGTEYMIGDGIALLSAALHGANILIIGCLRDRGCATARVLLWRCAVGALLLLPLCLADTQLFPISRSGWLAVIALAIVCQTFGQGLLVYSLKQFSSSFVGIFTLLKPLITALLAWVIFTEKIGLIDGVALILILFGIYLAKFSSSATVNAC
ncbi:DMT family transporter [Pleurocapsales cyanobacterium LEGE 10410]|nr:DMT family transporter [Pleurocapsales cyanobacterium LEGE 10410]